MDSDSQRENANGAAPSSAALESLLSDPALMDRLQETIRAIRSAGEMPAKEQPKTTEPPVREESRATPLREEENIHAGSIPDGLSAVLSNPEMMAKLPQIMAMLRGSTENEPAESEKAQPALSLVPEKRSPQESRNRLLSALKPFLSKERRDAVDAILRISQLGAVLRQIK